MVRRWDIFCRVIDNFGDIGVCWRLSRQLSQEYRQIVRLWVDDLPRFVSLAPTIDPNLPCQAIHGVEVWHWSNDNDMFVQIDPADVVIEAFACELPESYLSKMQQKSSLVWINLEYLSAEPWVKNYHVIPSPHPRSGLLKTCFFPGFVTGTGGLIREKDYQFEQVTFDHQSFLQQFAIPTDCLDATRVSLFCYDLAPVERLIEYLSQSITPILLIIPIGKIAQRITQSLGYPYCKAGMQMQLQQLTISIIPFLEQTDYDKLLNCCDINFVRGEDSFVRAQYAAQAFVWNIYPQEGQAHWQKLDAFLDIYTVAMPTDMKHVVQEFWYCWDGCHVLNKEVLFQFLSLVESLRKYNKTWCEQLTKQHDLASNLVQFVENQL